MKPLALVKWVSILERGGDAVQGGRGCSDYA